MRNIRMFMIAGALFVAYMVCVVSTLTAQTKPWATAYYAGWSQGWTNNGHLPAQNIDFGGVTHIVHFSLVPNSNGTLNPDANSMTSVNSSELLTAAHAAGKKVLISVGGWASDVGFRGATSSANRAVFVANLVSFMTTRGYDGIDIDWEVLQSSDGPQYSAFISALRTALNAVTPRPLLTAATSWEAGVFSSVHQHFDQINIMTYDMAGAWPGWVTWHNAAIYDGGYRFPSTSGAVPSLDGEVNRFIAAGIPAAKLGVGIDFYGYVWSGGAGTPAGGATEPRQSWTTYPSVQSNVPYHTIMQTYYTSSNYRWDASAQAAYLSIDNAGSSADKFISYDDQTSVKKKFEYARSKGIGGVIIWELGGGYRPDQPAGQKDLLLQAVKAELGGSIVVPDTVRPVVSISGPAGGATVSGAVSISAAASDDRGVAGVSLAVDGATVGSELTASPYAVSWNTLLAVNGTHQITATARDAAGNQATAQLNVTVSNSVLVPPPPPPVPPPSGSGDLQVYREALASPWMNVSWNVTITFSSTEKAYEGASSMKLTQGAWGGLSLHSGSWSAPVAVDPAKYTAVEFAVFPVSENVQLGALLENDQGASFPTVTRAGLPAGQWTVVSVPMTQLNPNRQTIHRLDVLEMSGTTKTFFLDNIRFVGSAAPPPATLAAPVLLSPPSGIRDLPTSVVLLWSPVSGAVSYRVQLSYSSSFNTTISDQSNITAATMTARSLGSFKRVYWRVAAVGTSGTPGPWSATWNFRTSSKTSIYTGTLSSDSSGAEESPAADIPEAFELSQNYPNPFNPSTTIAFAIPEETNVTLTIYNLIGEEVATLVSGSRAPGRYETTWNAGDVAGGFYIYRLTAGSFVETKKLLLIK